MPESKCLHALCLAVILRILSPGVFDRKAVLKIPMQREAKLTRRRRILVDIVRMFLRLERNRKTAYLKIRVTLEKE